MKKLIALMLTGCMVASIAGCAAAPAAPAAPAAEPAAEEAAAEEEAAPAEETAAAEGLIKVGVVNNPPSESGYREANVNDFISVFTEDNGYDAKFFYSIKNDEQLSAARQFITDGIDYLLISAAETTGWDAVLKDAQDAGISVFLFDRMIDCDPELFEAAVVSDMAQEGETAVNWLLAQTWMSTMSSTSRVRWAAMLSSAVPVHSTSSSSPAR